MEFLKSWVFVMLIDLAFYEAVHKYHDYKTKMLMYLKTLCIVRNINTITTKYNPDQPSWNSTRKN